MVDHHVARHTSPVPRRAGALRGPLAALARMRIVTAVTALALLFGFSMGAVAPAMAETPVPVPVPSVAPAVQEPDSPAPQASDAPATVEPDAAVAVEPDATTESPSGSPSALPAATDSVAGPQAAALADDLEPMSIAIIQLTPDTQGAGATFNYSIDYSCSAVSVGTCADSEIRIPLGAAASFPVTVAGIPAGAGAAHLDGTDYVIPLGTLQPGTSSQLVLSITPPNFTTANGTTWDVLPSITSDSTPWFAADTAAASTATASIAIVSSKTTPNAVQYFGDVFDYTLDFYCSTDTGGSGNIGALELVGNLLVTDALPVELTVVGSDHAYTVDAAGKITWTIPATDAPSSCGGNSSDSHLKIKLTVKANVLAPLSTKVTNTVKAEATALAQTAPVTSQASTNVTIYNPTVIPGNALTKEARGPIASASQYVNNATWAGNWLATVDPDQLNVTYGYNGVESSYVVTVKAVAGDLATTLVDDMPCTGNLVPGSNNAITSTPGALCADPAWNPTYISMVTTGDLTGFTPVATLTDGTTVDLESYGSGTAASASPAMYRVPASAVGSVTRIAFPASVALSGVGFQASLGGYADAERVGGDVLHNIATATFALNGAPVSSSQQATADLFILNSSQVGVWKTWGMYGSGGSTVYNTLAYYLNGRLDVAPGLAAEFTMTDLLPAGITSSNIGSATVTDVTGPGGVVVTPTLTVVDNFEGTGRTLVTMVLSADKVAQALSTNPSGAGRLDFSVSIRPITGIKPGVYVNTLQAFYDPAGPVNAICSMGSVPTAYPLDLTGTGQSPRCDDTITLTLPAPVGSAGFSLTKEVKGDQNATFVPAPSYGVISESGGSAEYRMTWTNRGASDLKGVVLYDLLPRIGDTGTIKSTAEIARGSQFTPTLTAVGANPAGVTTYYSNSVNPCRPEVFPNVNNVGCVDDWAVATTATDLSQVKALKYVSTKTYALGESIQLTLKMSAPDVAPNLIAWNTLAGVATNAATNGVLAAAEAPKVGIAASTAQLAYNKTTLATTGKVGDDVTYKVTATNVGSEPLTGVVATDTLDPNLVFKSATGGGLNTGQTITWPIATLAPTQSVTFTVVATIGSGAAVGSSLVNSFTVTSPDTTLPPVVGNPCADDATSSCAVVTVDPSPHVSVSKVVDKAKAEVGDTLTYTITAVNDGTEDLTDWLLYDVIPVGLTYVSSTPGGDFGGSDPDLGDIYTWSTADFPVGKTLTFQVTVTVNDGQSGSTLTNMALTIGGPPTTFTNECELEGSGLFGSCATTTVADNPALSIVKESCDQAVNGCDTDAAEGTDGWSKATTVTFDADGTWRVIVANTGDMTLNDVRVTDPVAPDLTWAIPTLAPGAFASKTATQAGVRVEVLNTVSVTASPADGREDLPPVTDTATITSEPKPVSELSIVKESCDTALNPCATDAPVGASGWSMATGVAFGADGAWRVTVTNTGATTLTDVRVTDATEAGLAWTIESLAPGASDSRTSDVPDVRTDLSNTATATATPPYGDDDLPPVTSTATITPQDKPVSALQIVKESCDPLASGCDAGVAAGADGWSEATTVQFATAGVWRVTVTNTGATTLTDVRVTDATVGDLTWTVDSLAPGASDSRTSDVPDIRTDLSNTATATATPPYGDDDLPSVTDTAVIEAAPPVVVPPTVPTPDSGVLGVYEVAPNVTRPSGGLASTGAEISGLVASALLLVGVGSFAVRRRRNAR